jgi:hypothetical protein
MRVFSWREEPNWYEIRVTKYSLKFDIDFPRDDWTTVIIFTSRSGKILPSGEEALNKTRFFYVITVYYFFGERKGFINLGDIKSFVKIQYYVT